MKIALVGYGNMGQEIEKIIQETGKHTLVSVSYKDRKAGLDRKNVRRADVAIDFTSPEIVLENIKELLRLGVPVVVGTTGWYGELPKVKQLVKKYKGSLIYGQNFSIGANTFFKIAGYASALLSKYEGYDVFGVETHHIGKKDSPSGTARKLADVILQNFSRKSVLQTEKLDRQIRSEELHFASVRGGRNFGRHEIVFDSQADEIRLMHQAWGRRGFAEGAIMAATFIKNKKGLYDFSSLFS
ncbi:MAG: 4-hydroxy-tetrahydrodipicolinate reductase [bacterium]|nr:4-hydroxy-tetrahydrodipicolinate reductase [bacterium]